MTTSKLIYAKSTPNSKNKYLRLQTSCRRRRKRSRSCQEIQNYGVQIYDEQYETICARVAVYAEHVVHSAEAVQPRCSKGNILQGEKETCCILIVHLGMLMNGSHCTPETHSTVRITKYILSMKYCLWENSSSLFTQHTK